MNFLSFFLIFFLGYSISFSSVTKAKKNKTSKSIVIKKPSKPLSVKNLPKATTPKTKPHSPYLNIPIDIEISARQMILMDVETGTVLLEHNADEKMHPSSMTKIMTANLVMELLQSGSLNEETLFSVSQNAWRLEGSSMMLNINQKVRVIDLLKGLIIQSGNDAAVTLAEGISGTEYAFAEMMTRKANSYGATQTTFKNASGLPRTDHLTTARDLALIALHSIRDYPSYYSIYKEKFFTFNNVKQGNRNPLLYRAMNCDGIKTGSTEIAKYGLVASCLNENQRFLLVANGLESNQTRADETGALINWASRTVKNYCFFKKGQIIDRIPIYYGQENALSLTTEKDIILCLPRGKEREVKITLKYSAPLQAPIQKGVPLGTIYITAPFLSQPLIVPLVSAHTIEKGGVLKCFGDSLKYFFSRVSNK